MCCCNCKPEGPHPPLSLEQPDLMRLSPLTHHGRFALAVALASEMRFHPKMPQTAVYRGSVPRRDGVSDSSCPVPSQPRDALAAAAAAAVQASSGGVLKSGVSIVDGRLVKNGRSLRSLPVHRNEDGTYKGVHYLENKGMYQIRLQKCEHAPSRYQYHVLRPCNDPGVSALQARGEQGPCCWFHEDGAGGRMALCRPVRKSVSGSP